MPDISNTSTPITADGDWTMAVVPGNKYACSFEVTTGTGTLTLKDSDGQAFRNADDSADLIVTASTTLNKHTLIPTGRQLIFTMASASSVSVDHNIVNMGKAC